MYGALILTVELALITAAVAVYCIALAVNSSTITSDDLSDLSSSVYQTLQNAGAIPGS